MQELSLKSGGGRNFGRGRNLGNIRNYIFNTDPTADVNTVNTTSQSFATQVHSLPSPPVTGKSFNMVNSVT